MVDSLLYIEFDVFFCTYVDSCALVGWFVDVCSYDYNSNVTCIYYYIANLM
jgi:hypothetical protein